MAAHKNTERATPRSWIIYRVMRPGEPPTVESRVETPVRHACSLMRTANDFPRSGRVKMNMRLALDKEDTQRITLDRGRYIHRVTPVYQGAFDLAGRNGSCWRAMSTILWGCF